MNRSLKVWGERILIRQDSTHCVSLLKLRARTRCSRHKHQAKSNLFYLLRGKVGIETGEGIVILHPGETFTVTPGEWHEFQVHEDSEMIEEMYVEYDEADIQRQDRGSEWTPPISSSRKA